MSQSSKHPANRALSVASAVAMALVALACGCSAATPDSAELTGAPDDIESSAAGVQGSIPVGSTLSTTAGVNFRKGPSTSYGVNRVLPEGSEVVTVDQTQSTKSFRKVQHQGTVGWVHTSYLQLVSSPEDDNDEPNGSAGTGGGGSDPQPSGTRAAAIQRAQQSVGFSYWWGHGRWRPEGVSSSTKGSCSGSCPSCSHSGSYGADCSGMVAKAWSVPSSNDDVTDDSHPYSTASFVASSSLWSQVSRGSLKVADALAYNNGSSGHVVLYESGDGWGDVWVYECRGCAAGCVHNVRSVSSSYKGIRRTGF